MAGRPSLNAQSLESLGAARLAALLLEHTEGNAAARRALRLAVAEVRGAAEMGQKVRQRLATIARSKRWLAPKHLASLLADLEAQRLAIGGPIADQAPQVALELLWRFLDLANPLLDRVDDSEDKALELFHRVSADLGRLALQAGVNPTALADQVAEALLANRHGQADLLVRHGAEALQRQGLLRLRQRLEAERPPGPQPKGPLLENEADDSEAAGVMVREVCPYLEPWHPEAFDADANFEDDEDEEWDDENFEDEDQDIDEDIDADIDADADSDADEDFEDGADEDEDQDEDLDDPDVGRFGGGLLGVADVWDGQEPLGTAPAVAIREDRALAGEANCDPSASADAIKGAAGVAATDVADADVADAADSELRINLVEPDDEEDRDHDERDEEGRDDVDGDDEDRDEEDRDDQDRRSEAPWQRSQTVRLAMLAIADGLGDAEAYLTEYREHRPHALRLPRIAARVAMRLTAAGQAEQALVQLDRAVLEDGLQSDGARLWIDARLEALEALGRQEEAQRLRYRFALERLSIPHLRAYLQRLPAFEDGEAQEQALEAVLRHRAFNRALEFLHRWPDHRRAIRLILERPSRLDGSHEALLKPLAQLLEAQGQPLAASLCLRAMLEAILREARSGQDARGVRYLQRCLQLAPSIDDWGKASHHNAWVVNLLRRYSHRQDFFNKMTFDPMLPEPGVLP
jgi:hypothetical protein